jgi:carbohydrate kinase (thermoresistant glucokinase family)
MVVMGVSGCGKSSVGMALAQALGERFIDGDDLHPLANKTKMAAGIPLDDDDRWPWLDLVGSALADDRLESIDGSERFTGTVIACSALKRKYRERILAAAPGTVFVHLDGPKELLAERMGSRGEHFMPLALLDSQLKTLEPLGSDEPGQVYSIEQPIEQIVATVVGEYGTRA